MSWDPTDEPDDLAGMGPLNYALAAVRFVLIAIVVYALMIILFVARLLETPFGKRPVSPIIVQLACRICLFLMRVELVTTGQPMTHDGAVVSNHASWLDIFTLNAAQKVYFVSKAEVSKWPAIGLVARSTGTVFIERRASQAKRHKSQFEERLLAGERLLFFPEGTSTDSRRVLGFKSTLFEAFFSPKLKERMWIQPVSLIYHAPKGEDPRYYGWWGDAPFAPHFLKTLGATSQGRAEIRFHQPVVVQDFKNRKTLAAHCEAEVRRGLENAIGASA